MTVLVAVLTGRVGRIHAVTYRSDCRSDWITRGETMDYDFWGLKSESQDHIIKNYCTIAHDYYLRLTFYLGSDMNVFMYWLISIFFEVYQTWLDWLKCAVRALPKMIFLWESSLDLFYLRIFSLLPSIGVLLQSLATEDPQPPCW